MKKIRITMTSGTQHVLTPKAVVSEEKVAATVTNIVNVASNHEEMQLGSVELPLGPGHDIFIIPKFIESVELIDE